MNKKIDEDREKNTDSGRVNFKEDKAFQILKLALGEIKERYNLDSNEILSLVEEKPVTKEILIPVSIFAGELSALETVCKYLKENLDLGFSKIALLLNRDSRTIWATYSNALKKRKERLIVKESRYFIPISALADRKFSALGSIVVYLKDKFSLRYKEISVLLHRDERNIWAAYHRVKK